MRLTAAETEEGNRLLRDQGEEPPPVRGGGKAGVRTGHSEMHLAAALLEGRASRAPFQDHTGQFTQFDLRSIYVIY